jgi:hypothetical protein
MDALESPATGVTAGIRHQQQSFFAFGEAGTPPEPGLQSGGAVFAAGRSGLAGAMGATPSGGRELRGHGLHHRAASALACAAVATLLGAGSYQGYEDICKRLTRRQHRALHCYYDRKNDRYKTPGDSTFYRVLCLIDPVHFE